MDEAGSAEILVTTYEVTRLHTHGRTKFLCFNNGAVDFSFLLRYCNASLAIRTWRFGTAWWFILQGSITQWVDIRPQRFLKCGTNYPVTRRNITREQRTQGDGSIFRNVSMYLLNCTSYMEAADTSEMSVCTYETTRRHIHKGRRFLRKDCNCLPKYTALR
jgi:hypothetical protein